MAIRLNIGAGDSNLPGFTPVDIKFGKDATKLDYADNSVDEIYASHVLEHIHHSKTVQTVQEWVRVLKPGGKIRIAVPDMGALLPRFGEIGGINHDLMDCWLYGSDDVPTDRHLATFTADKLGRLLQRCGCESIGTFEPEYNDCTRIPESLNFQAFKRKQEIPANPKVCMVLSRPRLAFSEMLERTIMCVRDLGWMYISGEGTEWGKGLTSAVKSALNTGCDYVFFLDYDGVFSPEDCKQLLKLMQDNPDVDAIYPVQMHRHRDGALGSMDSGDFSGELTPVTTGHFGCTIIRRRVFETIPQPWFMSFPDPITGEWEGKNSRSSLDADITFWMQMWEFGFKTCMANNVVIGHMELCVKWPTGNTTTWQTLTNYRKAGKPENVKFDGKFWKERLVDKKPVPMQVVGNEQKVFDVVGVNNGTSGK